jgi:hypothetical protein
MKLLTATEITQGKRASDFNWCEEGEPVTTGVLICDRDASAGPDGGCGCGRAFGGMRSGKSGTTAMVRDIAIGAEDLAFIVRSYREKNGWLALAEDPDAAIAEEVAEIIASAAAHPVGAVLETRMGEIGLREVHAERYDMCGLAKWAYAHGTDPIDWAIDSIAKNNIDVYLTITAARHEDPATFPGYTLELSPAALARRIVGDLLDAGWTPPEVTS